MDDSWQHGPDELLVGFTHALRAAGVPVNTARRQTFLRAVSVVGLGDRRGTYWAGRATLCAGPEDLDRFERLFAAWFRHGDSDSVPAPDQSAEENAAGGAGLDGDGGGDDEPAREAEISAAASADEVLRHRDIAELSLAERARLAALFDGLRPRLPRRPTSRRVPWRRGEVDTARTMRAIRHRMGEPAELAWRRRPTRERRLVLLVDVSGSMAPYADALLRLAYAFVQVGGAGRQQVEVFTIGTRLTHVTRALQVRDPERAVAAAGNTVADWSGGTRLGEVLRVFIDRWGRRGLARGAVAVVFSDGWERGDADLLARQARRLKGLARRVVWVNPHKGKAGYLPLQRGIVAVLPFVDDFVAGHSLAAFEELVEVVARA